MTTNIGFHSVTSFQQNFLKFFPVLSAISCFGPICMWLPLATFDWHSIFATRNMLARLLLTWLISTDLRFVNGSNIKLQLSDGRPSMTVAPLHCHGHISLSARSERREIVMKLICGSLLFFFLIRHHSYRQLSICPSVHPSLLTDIPLFFSASGKLHNFLAFQLFCICHLSTLLLWRFHRYSSVKLPSGKRRHFPLIFLQFSPLGFPTHWNCSLKVGSLTRNWI